MGSVVRVVETDIVAAAPAEFDPCSNPGCLGLLMSNGPELLCSEVIARDLKDREEGGSD